MMGSVGSKSWWDRKPLACQLETDGVPGVEAADKVPEIRWRSNCRRVQRPEGKILEGFPYAY